MRWKSAKATGLASNPTCSEGRLVLFPFGQPGAEHHRLHCEALLVHAGADVRRFVDPPAADLNAFVRYTKRISRALDPPPIVVLTRTNPIGLTLVQVRRELETAIPALLHATWFIYLSPEIDPFFLGSAQSLGSLSEPLHRAPLWIGPDDKRYLVISSCVMDPTLVVGSVAALDRQEPSRHSGLRAFARSPRGLGQPASRRPPSTAA